MNMPTPISLPSTGTVVRMASRMDAAMGKRRPVKHPTAALIRKISGMPNVGTTLGKRRQASIRQIRSTNGR